MATIPVSLGSGFQRTGCRRVCYSRIIQFADLWFIVSTVRTGGYENPRASLLICPLSEVLSSQLRVDLIVLCDLAERLSGLFIMAYRVNFRGVLHNITLPRSWFINLLPDRDLGKNVSSFFVFAGTLIGLMQRIDAQAEGYSVFALDTVEQFIVDGIRMTSFMGSLYIARM